MTTSKPDDRERKLVTHLEFLGYESRIQDDGWIYASHPVRFNFFLRPVDVGVRFHSSIRLGILSDEKRLDWLEFLNKINEASYLARFTLERDDPGGVFVIRIRTVAPGDYHRREFGVWMDMWHKDVELLRGGPEQETEVDDTEEKRAEVSVN